MELIKMTVLREEFSFKSLFDLQNTTNDTSLFHPFDNENGLQIVSTCHKYLISKKQTIGGRNNNLTDRPTNQPQNKTT